MSKLPFELRPDESIIIYGEMSYRKNAFDGTTGIGVITDQRFIFLVSKTNLLKTLVGVAAGGLIAKLIGTKAKILFELQTADILRITDKKIAFSHYINLETSVKSYILYPTVQRSDWDAAFQVLMNKGTSSNV